MDNIPCRVSADLAAHEASLRDGELIVWDEHDEGLFTDLCGKQLAKPVQELMLTLKAFEMTTESFGADQSKAWNQVLPELKTLREGLKDAMRDL